MNNEFKKGFLEAIDGVTEIILDARAEFNKENKAFKYELQKLENSVLNLKISLFETEMEETLKWQKELEEEDCIKEEKGDGLTEEEAIEDDCGPIIITKENILNYCKENGLTL